MSKSYTYDFVEKSSEKDTGTCIRYNVVTKYEIDVYHSVVKATTVQISYTNICCIIDALVIKRVT